MHTRAPFDGDQTSANIQRELRQRGMLDGVPVVPSDAQGRGRVGSGFTGIQVAAGDYLPQQAL
jgi:hypothetical protein